MPPCRLSGLNTGIHANNFDFLRMVAAITVLVVHHYALSGRSVPSISGFPHWATIAVFAFFSISGYLVTQSWFSDRNVWKFCLRRFLRIWPAFTAVVVICAMLVGPMISSLSAREYFASRQTWEYLYLLFMAYQDGLPGVFSSNPGYTAVNGSLWTIPKEVQCYLALAALACTGFLRHRAGLVFCISCFFVAYFFAGIPDKGRGHVPVWDFPAYFCMGALMFCAKNFWIRRKLLILLVSIVIFANLWWVAGWRYLAVLMALPVWIVMIGSAKTPVLHRAGRWGDFSYGFYIWAMPVQQFVISQTFHDWSFCFSMVASFFATGIFAVLSWHLIEKQALRLKPG